MNPDRHLPVVAHAHAAPKRSTGSYLVVQAIAVLASVAVAIMAANALGLSQTPWLILVGSVPVAAALALYNGGQYWKYGAAVFCFGIAGVIFTGPMADFRLPMKADRLGFVVFLIGGGWLATGSLYNALMLVGIMFSVWIGFGFL